MIASKATAGNIRNLDIPGMEVVLHFTDTPAQPVMLSLELARQLRAELDAVITEIESNQSPS